MMTMKREGEMSEKQKSQRKKKDKRRARSANPTRQQGDRRLERMVEAKCKKEQEKNGMRGQRMKEGLGLARRSKAE